MSNLIDSISSAAEKILSPKIAGASFITSIISLCVVIVYFFITKIEQFHQIDAMQISKDEKMLKLISLINFEANSVVIGTIFVLFVVTLFSFCALIMILIALIHRTLKSLSGEAGNQLVKWEANINKDSSLSKEMKEQKLKTIKMFIIIEPFVNIFFDLIFSLLVIGVFSLIIYVLFQTVNFR